MRFYSRGSVIMTKRSIMKINCKHTPTHMDSAMAVTVNVPTFEEIYVFYFRSVFGEIISKRYVASDTIIPFASQVSYKLVS
jgi:hypothetical protein